jgi:predicted dehydrogenase
VRESPDLRVGLIGYGLAGSVFHAPLITTTPGMRLAAVVTSDPERSRKAAREHPGARIMSKAELLWADAPNLDLVVVATPNRTHAALAEKALESGLPVVVDKPLAPIAAEGQRLIEAAERAKLLLTVFHNRRWDGDFLTVRRLLHEGAFGTVRRFESRFERWRPTPKPGWRLDGAPEAGGGLLFDLGSHLIDQALLLFGPVQQVYAELDRRSPEIEVDEDSFVALTHTSGVRSHLWMSSVAAQRGPRMRVLGSRAAYTKFGFDVQEEALRSGGRPDEPRWGEEDRGAWGQLGAGDDVRPVRTEAGAYQEFYKGVVRALRDGALPPVDPAEAVAGLAIIEAARRSARAGRVISMRQA